MSAILGKKDFTIDGSTGVEILDFILSCSTTGDEIRIIIQKAGEDRQKKTTAKALLNDAVAGNDVFYTADGYDFNFHNKVYRWKEKRVHITASEALFLYRWLVLNEQDRSQMYYIYNIRKRYGKEFLQEVIRA